MGGLLALINPIAGIIDKIIPDKSAAAAAKAQLMQLQLQGQLNAEMQELQSSSSVITAEANSKSWLPRNVRPLLLLLWGCIITFNELVPMIARLWYPGLQPLALDPWVYKLTAIGFTGYVTARTWEKVTNSDN
jgi:hypothetical protein